MKMTQNTKKLIVTTIIASLLAPALSHSAALPEESDRHTSPAIQDIVDTRLFHALERHDLFEVQQAITDGANLNSTHPIFNSSTPLHKAIEKKSASTVKILIKAGADLKKYDYLSEAIQSNSVQSSSDAAQRTVVAALIDAGADINGETYRAHKLPQEQRYCKSPLLHATPSRDGVTAKDATIMQELINANADVNIQDGFEKQTALIYLTCTEKNYGDVAAHTLNMIRQLILAGADTTIQDRSYCTAFDYATENDHYPDMVKVMETALRDRDDTIQQKLEQQGKKPIQEDLEQAHDYLLAGPLPLEPLSQIFLKYATEADAVLLARRKAERARVTQQQKAQTTEAEAAAWQADHHKALQLNKIERERRILREEAAAARAQQFATLQSECADIACSCCMYTVCLIPFCIGYCCIKGEPPC